MTRTTLVLLALLCGCGAVSAADFSFAHENVMGTSFELSVTADDAAAALWAEARVLAEIDRLSAIFSGYDPASEFRRWQDASNGPTKISPELFKVLQDCDTWRARSGGVFDARVEVLSNLWRHAADRGWPPSDSELAAARVTLERGGWRLGPLRDQAERLDPMCPMTLNAIAKGYIVERACQAALDPSRGVRGIVLNIGGDARVSGAITRDFSIADPAAASAEPIAVVTLRDKAIATSGNTHRGFRIQDRWYSHIIDPRSGRPVESIVIASVIADRSADADALATIFNVLPIAESLKMADSLPGVACLLVEPNGRVTRSARWSGFEKPHAAQATARSPEDTGKPPAPAPSSFWGDEFELVVDFEIAPPVGSRSHYRRPYIAVWVEDTNGMPVRTIELWLSMGGPGFDQWIQHLKRWMRGDKARKMVDKRDLAHTISQPTRSPGKYTTVWDGKDDHGKPVPPGDYVVTVESAREHGTYQSIRKQVTIAATPFAEELKGNDEIKSAAIAYRRKGPGK